MIAGAGGINSWFIKTISDLCEKEQIPMHWEFTIFDGDNIESKNLTYQNFLPIDLLQDKATVLGERYGIDSKVKYIKRYVYKSNSQNHNQEKGLKQFEAVC